MPPTAPIRIGILQSSYEGSSSWHQEATHDELGGGDPSKYISQGYEFKNLFVRKTHEREDIDTICTYDYDYFLNFLWGGPRDDVAGITAVRYLGTRSKIPIIGHTADMLEKHYNKTRFYKDALQDNVRIPINTPGRFPKIVKYGDTLGSVGLTLSSVCVNQKELTRQIDMMTSGKDSDDVIVQDYIAGIECSAVILEMGKEPVALAPLRYVFPENVSANEAFLTFENKFEAVDKGILKYAFFEDEVSRKAVQDAAVAAFKSAGMLGGAWARVDMRIDDRTGEVYVLEVNPFPCIFCPIGNTFGDDLVIEETFPGGHIAVMDVLIATSRIQHDYWESHYPVIARIHDKISTYYDETSRSEPLELKIAENMKHFDFGGSVLDLGCGTGYVGELLGKKNPESLVTGVDISPGMLRAPSVQRFYKEHVLEPIQTFVFRAECYDHVVCYSALHFFDNPTCTAIISRMFMLARKSVIFEIDDLCPEYLKAFSNYADGAWQNYNNTAVMAKFPTPPGWVKVQDEYRHFYKSVHLNMDVSGTFFRFERM